MRAGLRRIGFGAMVAAGLFVVACGHETSPAADSPKAASPSLASAVKAPSAETTGGFDGARAYKHVERLVAIGPHPAGSDGIRRAQAYITEQLKSFGCPVEEQDFHASTPVGNVAMKNILVKIPSANPSIVLYATHYDSKRLDNRCDSGAGPPALRAQECSNGLAGLSGRPGSIQLWVGRSRQHLREPRAGCQPR